MAGVTDYSARKLLDHLTGKTSFTMPTAYMGIFTVAPTDAGGGTEVSGGSYTRVATSGATWNAAAGSAPASTSNSAAITFPTATGAWGTNMPAFGFFDASTVGNLLWWDYFGSFSYLPFTCTSASPGVLTVPAHGFSNGDTVIVTAEFGGTLPATAGSWAGLLTVAGVTTDTFNVGVNTTGTGDGMVRKVTPITVASSNTLSFAGGTPGTVVLTGA